jgi:hypothetical protein
MRFRRTSSTMVAVVACLAALSATAHAAPVVTPLASFAAPGCTGACGQGSTMGPDGALYVTDPKTGRVLRIAPSTGATTTFARGLPLPVLPIGGAVDVAFLGGTAYVLVALTDPSGTDPDIVDGLFRVNADGSVTPVADVGAFSATHLPPVFDAPAGNPFALEVFEDGFLMTDGNHNRILRVTPAGDISQLLQLGNVVPTGLEVTQGIALFAQAGPVPHLPQNGRVMVFKPGLAPVIQLTAGVRLAVDVELGLGHTFLALSQGIHPGGDPATPASPNTGSLMRIVARNRVTTLVSRLDRPTSLEVVGTTAFVVTLGGDVLRIDDAYGPPFG